MNKNSILIPECKLDYDYDNEDEKLKCSLKKKVYKGIIKCIRLLF